MKNTVLRDKLIATCRIDLDTHLSLVQYQNKIRRLKLKERQNENGIRKMLDRLFRKEGWL